MIEGWEHMTDGERRDAIWGLRDGCEPHMNRVRREMFEWVKALLFDSRQYASAIEPAPESNIVRLSNYLPAKRSRHGNLGLVRLVRGWALVGGRDLRAPSLRPAGYPAAPATRPRLNMAEC